jgi:hypothetical protein
MKMRQSHRDAMSSRLSFRLEEESSSRHLLVALENLLERSHYRSISLEKKKIRYRSKSVDDLFIKSSHRHSTSDRQISCTTRTALDLSDIDTAVDTIDESVIVRCQSAPISLSKIDDQQLVAFINGERQQQEQVDSFSNQFTYNIDLSDTDDVSTLASLRSQLFDVSVNGWQ